jgi:hypothetical protein
VWKMFGQKVLGWKTKGREGVKKVDELWRAVLLCGILRLGEGERRMCDRCQE